MFFCGLSIRPDICLVSATTPKLRDRPILMKLYSQVVYNMRMCIKEDNPGLTKIKGDNYLFGTWSSFVIGLTVLDYSVITL